VSGLNPVDAGNRRDGSWAEIRLPAVPGCDASGIVHAAGAEASGFEPGDEVFYFSDIRRPRGGSCAEYQAIDAEVVARKPRVISHAQAAGVPLAAGTAYEIVRRLALRPDERLIVYGAGGAVGGYSVQLAALAGARVTAVAGVSKHPLLRSLGAERTLDYRDEELDTRLQSAGPAADAVADLFGADVAPRSLGWLRDGGRLASISSLDGDLELAIDKNVTVHGILVSPDGPRLRHLAALIERGALCPASTQEFALDDVVAAHRALEGRHDAAKLAVRIREHPV
jgi:NADPH2:quinone reductase